MGNPKSLTHLKDEISLILSSMAHRAWPKGIRKITLIGYRGALEKAGTGKPELPCKGRQQNSRVGSVLSGWGCMLQGS
jgi:hypothetical protein